MTTSAVPRLSGWLSRVGLVRSPGLQTDEDRSASRLELFFDLAFVLVVAELTHALSDHLSGTGVLTFVGLFVVTWWAWASATLYANRFDTDDVLFRLFKLTGMLAVIGMAASAAEATGKNAVPFAACYTVTRVLLFVQYLRAWRATPEARETLRLYLLGTGAGAAFWAASLLVPGPLRYGLWVVGLLVDVVVPFAATFAPGEVPLHLEHLPERVALFVILVLGESVASVAAGVHDREWTREAAVVGALAFLLTAALWWTTFDLAGAAAKQLLLEHVEAGRRLAQDIFFYGHLPTTLGLAAVGVGIKNVILESTGDEPRVWTRVVLCGGVALYLAAVGTTNAAMADHRSTGWWWAVLAGLVAVADGFLALPAGVVVAALAVLVTVAVVAGIVQENRGRLELEQL